MKFFKICFQMKFQIILLHKTPFNMAVEECSKEIVQFLLTCDKVDVNLPNKISNKKFKLHL